MIPRSWAARAPDCALGTFTYHGSKVFQYYSQGARADYMELGERVTKAIFHENSGVGYKREESILCNVIAASPAIGFVDSLML